ncbi:MAG: hypothetical protein JHC86_08245, partial [Ilumatobacteraceae bacterium]|nr:hypothetical protein [Ilumatobacteraceae bacterium]
ATLTSVRRPTYTFGIAAGLLVSLLILLQLTYTDSRIRSVRQLTRSVGIARLLGHVAKTEDAVRDRRTAVAVHHALGTYSATRLRYLPLRDPLNDSAALQRIATMSGVVAKISVPFTELSVPELTTLAADEVDVVVVRRNRDLRADLVEVLAALDRSGRSVAGVVLVD